MDKKLITTILEHPELQPLRRFLLTTWLTALAPSGKPKAFYAQVQAGYILFAMSISARKLKHIKVCLEYPVAYTTKTTGFETVSWAYNALPEMQLEDVQLQTSFLGKPLRAPLLIGAMTGGVDFAATINKNLAIAAETLGLGLMLGSQRVMLENAQVRPSFAVRQYAPNALLIGNLGVAQFKKGYDATQAKAAIELIGADAIAFHTNPLQEALQIGGDTNFSGLIPALEKIVPEVGYPVMLKEVGHGISKQVAEQIKNVGFAALDVAGAGGTSWAKVEDFAHHGKLLHPDLCELGIPTLEALEQCRAALPAMPLVASGGIRSGLDIAKALSKGAAVCAVALPLLEPATRSPEAVMEVLERLVFELRVALFVAGKQGL
ncbi:MAG: type 2 isopentenyl-diphosphate Delta-isomerase [Deinococcales bacterium]